MNALNRACKCSFWKRVHELAQRLPKLINVFFRLGQVVGKIHFVLFALAQLVNGQLKTVVVLVKQALHLDKVVLIENVDHFLHVVPDLGFYLPGSIRERHRDVQVAGLLRFDLLGSHNKRRGDVLVLMLRRVANVEFLHRGLPKVERVMVPVREVSLQWGLNLRADRKLYSGHVFRRANSAQHVFFMRL